jgi:hypothetical protein
MQPKGANLKCPELELAVSFDSMKLVVDDQSPGIEYDFRGICEDVLKTIKLEFGLRSYLRWGMRQIDIVGTDSSDEAEALSAKASPAKGWVSPSEKTMGLQQCSTTAVFETPDHGKGVRLCVQAARKIGAPLEPDERLRVPPRLLSTGQHEALVAQLRNRKRREEDPDAGVVIDRDYYWVKPTDPTVEAFFPEAEEEIRHTLKCVMEKLQ